MLTGRAATDYAELELGVPRGHSAGTNFRAAPFMQ